MRRVLRVSGWLQFQVDTLLQRDISSNVASPLQWYMCSSVIPPSAVPFIDSLTQLPFFTDLVEHVSDFLMESQIQDLQSINQVWSFYLIYFLCGDVIDRVSSAKCTVVGFAPVISYSYAIEWRCIWIECKKIQDKIKKQLLNRFRDHIVEGQVYRMTYFTVVSNHGSYRATSHEFKLVFLHRTTVVAVDEDVIPKTCFNKFPFSELLNMTQDYDFLVDVIGLLTSVGEEKEYTKEGNIVKMIVLELTSKEYVDSVISVGFSLSFNHLLSLFSVSFFVIRLQNVMYATQMLFNPDLPEVVEFRQSMIEQGVNGTQPLFIANEGKVISLEDDFMHLTRKCTIEELQNNNEVDIFCLICGDTYPPIFQGLIGKKLLLKVDTKGIAHDKFYGTFRVRKICDDPTIISMFKLPNYDADDESTPKKEPDLHKSVSYGKGDIGIKKESSKTFIKSDKVAGESSRILSKSPVLIDFLAEKKPAVSGGTEFAALINHENGKDEKTPENDTVSDDLSAELDILLITRERNSGAII
ncbi:hypothetical protein Ahy_A07g035775 [Arachis hypogaea]|uniref:Replication protein A 70 kDa DNA-binding subunit B/D first OB fold domain-containing protein n=1 Tax=Arachis hypogaea TaxID=3818 RepID=A0A445CEE6_ARAHY|nr:hypothetical protein Ahy_A07g035775 [Arachis hypogaea]